MSPPVYVKGWEVVREVQRIGKGRVANAKWRECDGWSGYFVCELDKKAQCLIVEHSGAALGRAFAQPHPQSDWTQQAIDSVVFTFRL